MLYMPREEGQGLVEYALILVLVAVVVIVILALLGPAIGNIFSNLVTNWAGADGFPSPSMNSCSSNQASRRRHFASTLMRIPAYLYI